MTPRRLGRTAAALAMLMLVLHDAPSGAQEVISRLFHRLETGMSLKAAEAALKDAGAKIGGRRTASALAGAACRDGDASCRKKLLYVDRIAALYRGRLYAVQLTSSLTGNRVYSVATVGLVPKGLSMTQHRERISTSLDTQPTVRGRVAFWAPAKATWVLILSWNGRRYTAIKRDNRLLREDRIAHDRRRRGR